MPRQTRGRRDATFAAAQRKRDDTAPPESFNDSELAGAIYCLQGRLASREDRLAGRVNETVQSRIRELLAEQKARRVAS